VGHDVPGLLRRVQGTPRFGQESLARFCEFHPPCCADEEFCTELALERTDRVRQRGLRNVATICGSGEVSLIGHRDEVLKVSQLHQIDLVLR
jgi:hypothetical protein